MTNITIQDSLKSKKNFEEFISENFPREILSTLAGYPKAEGKEIAYVTELTQNSETFFRLLNEVKVSKRAPYYVWIVNTAKEDLLKGVEIINQNTLNEFGIFVFKADLNNDKMQVECLLKPEIKEKQKSNTQEFNLKYWNKYKELCGYSNSIMQIKPNDRQFKTISIGKAGIQIMQTVSKTESTISSEIYIQNDKELFDTLLAFKDEIEEKTGPLNWMRLDNRKASRIVKTVKVEDIEDFVKMQSAINEQIKNAEMIYDVFAQYI